MKEEQALRDLLLALRNIAQCRCFSDIETKVTPDFRNEIDRILESLTPNQ